MKKKYVFTKESRTLSGGIVVRRIKALRDFGCVKKGELGGWIEHEANLSHDGDCWVFDKACVCDNAQVYDDAQISDEARVFGNACVYDKAKVYGKAEACGNAKIYNKAKVYGNACVCSEAFVLGNACIYGKAYVYDEAFVYDRAKVCCKAQVGGAAEICGNAVVKSMSDYLVFKNTWSSGRWFTYTASNKMWKVGCFYGTGKELVAKAKKDSKLSGKCYKLIVKTTEALEKAKLSEKES